MSTCWYYFYFCKLGVFTNAITQSWSYLLHYFWHRTGSDVTFVFKTVIVLSLARMLILKLGKLCFLGRGFTSDRVDCSRWMSGMASSCLPSLWIYLDGVTRNLCDSQETFFFAKFFLNVECFRPFTSYPTHLLMLVARRIVCWTTVTKFSDWICGKYYVFLRNPPHLFCKVVLCRWACSFGIS